jgi:ubiquitin-protein ligase
VQMQSRDINAAHLRRHPRAAKQVQLDTSAHRVTASLLRTYAKQDRPLPSTYAHLARLKERVQMVVPPPPPDASCANEVPYWYALHREVRSLAASEADPDARRRLLQARQRLLRRDLVDFLQPVDAQRPPQIHAAPESSSLLRWRAVMCGPPGTPWEWVTVEMRVDFPRDYPGSAPTITLVTPLVHPNVDPETGAICADLLTANGWSAACQLHGLLLTLQSLLLAPNTASPLNARAAALYDDAADDVRGPFWSEVYRVHEQNMGERRRERVGPRARPADERIEPRLPVSVA